MKKTIAIVLSALMIMCFMPTMAFAGSATTAIDLSTATFDAIPDQVYTGSPIEPDVAINGVKLTKGVDYTITASSGNTAVGVNVKITVTAAKDTTKYTGHQELTFNIVPKDIADSTVKWQPVPNKKVGEKITETDVVLMDGKTPLIKITDYTYTCANAAGAIKGSNKIVIEGAGNYKGTREEFITAGMNIESGYEIVTTGSVSYEYTGKAIEFSSVTVKETLTGKTLTLNNDFTATYKDNIKYGKATLTITGIGEYAGTLVKQFEITQRSIGNASIAAIDNQVSGVYPSVTVTDNYGSVRLIEGEDYNCKYSESATSGTVTVTGYKNYKGVISRTYNIKRSIIGARVITPPVREYGYTGSAITLSPTVILDNGYPTTTLRNGIDYRVDYANNVNMGYATMNIVGIGEYAGTILGGFIITQKDITGGRITVSPSSVQFNGKEQKPTISVYDGVRYLSATDYDVSYLNNTKIGKATVYVTGKGNYKGSLFATFDIVGNSIASTYISLSQTEYTYDGYAKQPTVTVKDGYTTLTNGVHYTLDYKDNVKAGTATVTITGKGDYSGSTTRTFSIRGLDQTLSTNYTRYTKYLSSDSFMLGARATGDGTGFSYTSSDNSVVQVSSFGTVTVVGTGVATITVSTVGNTKYTPVSKLVTVTVKPNRAVYRVTSPSEGKLKVQITKGTGVTKYQIRYGRNGNYRNSYYTYSDSFYSTQSRTFRNLDSGSKYYVKVRAYKTMPNGLKAWGNWGTIKAVRVK